MLKRLVTWGVSLLIFSLLRQFLLLPIDPEVAAGSEFIGWPTFIFNWVINAAGMIAQVVGCALLGAAVVLARALDAKGCGGDGPVPPPADYLELAQRIQGNRTVRLGLIGLGVSLVLALIPWGMIYQLSQELAGFGFRFGSQLAGIASGLGGALVGAGLVLVAWDSSPPKLAAPGNRIASQPQIIGVGLLVISAIGQWLPLLIFSAISIESGVWYYLEVAQQTVFFTIAALGGALIGAGVVLDQIDAEPATTVPDRGWRIVGRAGWWLTGLGGIVVLGPWDWWLIDFGELNPIRWQLSAMSIQFGTGLISVGVSWLGATVILSRLIPKAEDAQI